MRIKRATATLRAPVSLVRPTTIPSKKASESDLFAIDPLDGTADRADQLNSLSKISTPFAGTTITPCLL